MRSILSAPPNRRQATFVFPGILATTLVTNLVPVRVGGRLLSWDLVLIQAPHTQSVIFDILLFNALNPTGTSIFGGINNPTYAPTDILVDSGGGVFSIPLVGTGDCLQGIITQVGSGGVPGDTATLILYW